MTYREFYKKIEDAYIKYIEDGDYWDIGVRFEDRTYNVGDTVANSKHNPDREDERDFPEYGTQEYDELPELDGACAWHLGYRSSTPDFSKIWGIKKSDGKSFDDEVNFYGDHCYIIHSETTCTHSDCDENEVVYEDAVVLEVIY